MNIQEQIKKYFESLSDTKRTDLESLHKRIIEALPDCKLWCFDGKDENGKIITNPNIGYGLLNLKYANGKTKEFYQVGISANTTGISVYFMGLDDKTYLTGKYKNIIGKASISGYCIKFRKLQDINMNILEDAIIETYQMTK